MLQKWRSSSRSTGDLEFILCQKRQLFFAQATLQLIDRSAYIFLFERMLNGLLRMRLASTSSLRQTTGAIRSEAEIRSA